MALASIQLPQETIMYLGQMADITGDNLSEIADKAIRQYLRREAEKKIALEEKAFQKQHQQLLEKYKEHYIAMHNSKVIDHDRDEMELYLRIRKQFPSIGILIKQVTPEIDIIWQSRSPRWEYQ